MRVLFWIAIVLSPFLTACRGCGDNSCRTDRECNAALTLTPNRYICHQQACRERECGAHLFDGCGLFSGQRCVGGLCVDRPDPIIPDMEMELENDAGSEDASDAATQPLCLTEGTTPCSDRTTLARHAVTPDRSAGLSACDPEAVWGLADFSGSDVRHVALQASVPLDDIQPVSLWDAVVPGFNGVPRVASLTPGEYLLENPIVVQSGMTLALVSPCWDETTIAVNTPIQVEEGGVLIAVGIDFVTRSDQAIFEVRGGTLSITESLLRLGSGTGVAATEGGTVVVTSSILEGSGTGVKLDGGRLYAAGVWFDKNVAAVQAEYSTFRLAAEPFANLLSITDSHFGVPPAGTAINASRSVVSVNQTRISGGETGGQDIGLQLDDASTANIVDTTFDALESGVRGRFSRVFVRESRFVEPRWGILMDGQRDSVLVEATTADSLYHFPGPVLQPEYERAGGPAFTPAESFLPKDRALPGDSVFGGSAVRDGFAEFAEEHLEIGDSAPGVSDLFSVQPQLEELGGVSGAFPLLHISTSTIEKARGAGIVMRDSALVSSELSVAETNFSGILASAVVARDPLVVQVDDSLAERNGGWGWFFALSSPEPAFSFDNSVGGPTNYGGLLVVGTGEQTIEVGRPRFHENRFHGALFVDLDAVTVGSGLLEKHGDDGAVAIETVDVRRLDVSNTTVRDNAGYGLYFSGLTELYLGGNSWENNGMGDVGGAPSDVAVFGDDTVVGEVESLPARPRPATTDEAWVEDWPADFFTE